MSAPERWTLWVAAGLTVLSGAVYFWMKYLLVGSDPYSVVHHPWQPVVLKVHVLAAPVLVFALGMIAVRHVWAYWSNGAASGRRSGVGLVWVAGPMVLTGYLIQVLTDERWLRLVGWAHVALGLGFAVGLVAHRWLAGRGRGRNNRGPRVQR